MFSTANFNLTGTDYGLSAFSVAVIPPLSSWRCVPIHDLRSNTNVALQHIKRKCFRKELTASCFTLQVFMTFSSLQNKSVQSQKCHQHKQASPPRSSSSDEGGQSKHSEQRRFPGDFFPPLIYRNISNGQLPDAAV